MSDRGSGSGGHRRSSRLGFLCHASSIEVVVALSVGSKCTRIPYFRLSYLIGPFQQLLGLTPSRGPFLSMSGLTPSRGPFHHHRVLLLHEAHFIIIGSYSFTRPISANPGTTLSHLRFLKLRSVRLNLQLFQLIPDGGSISLISGLSSNFSVRGKKLPQCGITGSMVRPMDKSEEFPYSRASILSPIWEILQEVSIRLDRCRSSVTLGNLPQYRPPCHGAKWDGALYEMRPLEGGLVGTLIESQRFFVLCLSVGGIPDIRLGNVFLRTIIYLDVATAVGITWESLPPLPVVLGYHLKLPSRFSLRGSSLQSAQLMPLGLACPPSSFVFIASLILSSIGIKFTRNCNCKPIIRLKYGFFRVSTKILIISFSSRRGHARGRHFSPPLGVFSENLAALLLHSLTVKAGAIFRQYICRWIMGSPLPLYFSNSGALNLGGTVMLGNQDMLEKSVFPKEFKPCMSLIFSSKLSILLSNWESFPSGFGGVGGLGGVALVLM
uniref:Uncharacterized protein n=1 Tax=Fagus sylvatica TaxID=28930 RepID=A0A2N9FJL7_FAGSY